MTSSPLRSGRSGRSGRRSAVTFAGLALAAGLTGCGDDSVDTATDRAPSVSPAETPSETATETASETASETPTETPSPETGQSLIEATGSAGVSEATLVSATEGGGSASTLAFALDTDQAVADFAAQFEAGLGATVTTAAESVAQEGATTYGATAAVGCDAPASVAIEAGEAGFEVVAEQPETTVECFAPVTYVVLFAVPDA